MTRLQKILAHIDPSSGRGVELGPLMSPIVTRDMGDIVYVDRAPRDELVRWFAGNREVAADRIVEVDCVWDDRTLAECLGDRAAFDFCIASHVLEHVPDLIGSLRQIHAVLVDHGILSVVLPDKRYTFDCLRTLTTAADIVDAYLEKRRRPSGGQIFDHFSNLVDVEAAALWRERPDRLGLRPKGPNRELLQICEDAREHGKYIDSHCWVFTPASFFELLKAIAELQLMDFEVLAFTATAEGENEFFVSLRKLPAAMSAAEKADLALASIAARVDPLLRAETNADPAEPSATRDEVQVLRERIAAMEAELSVLRMSRSWRLTAPLRTAAGAIRRRYRRKAPDA